MRLSPILLAVALCSVTATAAAQTKPTLTPKDIAKWEQLGAARLSPDGNWISYTITRGNEENDLRFRGGAHDTTIVIPFGIQPAFAANSHWAASLIGVAPRERDRLTKDKKPVHNSFAARNLRHRRDDHDFGRGRVRLQPGRQLHRRHQVSGRRKESL